MNVTFVGRRRCGVVSASVLVLATAFVAPATASLIGDTVTGTTSDPVWVFDPVSAVVTDPGIEFGLRLPSARAFDVDLGASTIDFDVLIDVGNIFGLGPATLSDLDWVNDPTGRITGFHFNTDIVGMDATRLSHTDHSFSVDFDGLNTIDGQFLDIALETSDVPEPCAIWPLLSLVGAGVHLQRRRRAKRGTQGSASISRYGCQRGTRRGSSA